MEPDYRERRLNSTVNSVLHVAKLHFSRHGRDNPDLQELVAAIDHLADAYGKLSDTVAMYEIHKILDGKEWSSSTPAQIARWVLATGRVIRPAGHPE